MVVEEGDRDRDGDWEGVEVVDLPNAPPPSLSGFSKPWAPFCHRLEGGGDPLFSPGAGAGVRGGRTCFFLPARTRMTVMWIFRRLIRCLIRRREGKHRGTMGEDASSGGVWVWKPLPSTPLAPMPESISAGSLPALQLLFDPRAVRFGTRHYHVVLQHFAQLGRFKQWRQGKAVVFPVDWATVLALPRPIYDPGCQASYEGLIPNSRSVKAASVAVNAAKPAAQCGPNGQRRRPHRGPNCSVSLPRCHGGGAGS